MWPALSLPGASSGRVCASGPAAENCTHLGVEGPGQQNELCLLEGEVQQVEEPCMRSTADESGCKPHRRMRQQEERLGALPTQHGGGLGAAMPRWERVDCRARAVGKADARHKQSSRGVHLGKSERQNLCCPTPAKPVLPNPSWRECLLCCIHAPGRTVQPPNATRNKARCRPEQKVPPRRQLGPPAAWLPP